MRASVYWYSGTGNSWLAAGRLAERLAEGGVESALVPMEEGAAREGDSAAEGDSAVEGDSAELEVFCFPVYAFDAPSAVARFVASLPALPPAAPRKAALIATMGGKGYEGRALRRLGRLLSARGRKVVLAEALEMPEAFVQAYPATPPEAARERTAAALALADLCAAELLSGKGRRRKDSPFARILLAPVSILFALAGRRLLGLSWGCDGAACTGCGLCARACPAGNIRMRSRRPSFGATCEDCQRCANLCPTGAIRVSTLKLLVYVILAIPSYGRILSGLLGLGGLSGPFGLLLRPALWLSGALAAYAAAALAFRVAESRPAGRNFLARSYAKGFLRRLAPGFAEELARRDRELRLRAAESLRP